MRIILYSGKGGVGKTSISAATGLELARRSGLPRGFWPCGQLWLVFGYRRMDNVLAEECELPGRFFV